MVLKVNDHLTWTKFIGVSSFLLCQSPVFMRSHVPLQVLLPQVLLGAEMALVFLMHPKVRLQVPLEMLTAVETLVAHVADVALLGGVAAHVSRKVSGDTLVADVAPVGLLTGVPPDVALEVAAVRESHPAEGTVVALLARMDAQMLPEVLAVYEALRALRALNALLRHADGEIQRDDPVPENLVEAQLLPGAGSADAADASTFDVSGWKITQFLPALATVF